MSGFIGRSMDGLIGESMGIVNGGIYKLIN